MKGSCFTKTTSLQYIMPSQGFTGRNILNSDGKRTRLGTMGDDLNFEPTYTLQSKIQMNCGHVNQWENVQISELVVL